MNSKIIILYDKTEENAPLDELDTLIQAEQIEKVLTELKYSVRKVVFDGNLQNLELLLLKEKPILVFNLVETYYKSRFLHLIPLLCEKLNIKVSGGSANSLYLSGDKLFAKKLMEKTNIPTPPYIKNSEKWELEFFIGKTMIAKPKDEEASVGITDDSIFCCSTIEELQNKFCISKKENQLLELYIEGKEVNVSATTKNGTLEILPMAEMVFTDYPVDKPKIVTYEAKWVEDSFAYKNTVRSFDFEKENPVLAAKIKEIVKISWELFDCRGYVRFDFRVDEKGNPYLLELNVNPAISKDSGYVAASLAKGYSYSQTIENIVKEALYG
ncbi:MAG: ATP-grasp domain-containing protein [Sphaerochaetaceae bacterium]